MKSSFVFLALLLIGCSSGSSVREPVLPEKIAPDWTRKKVEPLETAKFPAVLQTANVQRGWQTDYRTADGATVHVDAYAIRSNTQGLDLVQRWRPERDHAQFYTDHFLLNVAWQGAKHDELAALVRSLPKIVEGQQR